MTTQSWNYFNPVHVMFEPGGLSRIGASIHHQRVAVVTSPGFTRRGVVDRLRESFGDRLVAVVDDVKPNPDVLDIDAQGKRLRSVAPDCLLGLGGGSSMDTAKALARLLTQRDGTTLAAHFRDQVALDDMAALPIVAVPTTAGTGAEVTPFGTVWDFEKAKKYSVAGDDLYPAVAILDPELTVGLPEDVTTSSGLDAISHALESAWNKSASPITLGLSAKSLQLSLSALPDLVSDPDAVAARGRMMQASLLAGLAISQTRTALAHSISYPLTARFNLPHGIACSFTLPALLRFNAGSDDGRLLELARAVGCRDSDALVAQLGKLFALLGVADLFLAHVSQPETIFDYVGEMFTPGRSDNNLRGATSADVRALLRSALNQVASGYRRLDSVMG